MRLRRNVPPWRPWKEAQVSGRVIGRNLGANEDADGHAGHAVTAVRGHAHEYSWKHCAARIAYGNTFTRNVTHSGRVGRPFYYARPEWREEYLDSCTRPWNCPRQGVGGLTASSALSTHARERLSLLARARNDGW